MERSLRWLGLAALSLAFASGCQPADAPRDPRVSVSLLAVGDTGKSPDWVDWLEDARGVARAIAREDAERPADALVLLGDNFYPAGLKREDVQKRLRENVAAPFCRFLTLTARGADSLREACPESAARHPIPLFAVLGNHDYDTPESPALERELVPEYIASWHMPEGVSEVRELPGGLSLILLDSEHLERHSVRTRLVQAIAASRGPWRVIAAHHPMIAASQRHDARFDRKMEDLIARAGVPIHVYLAGHEHNLQAFVAPGGSPALLLIAGSGSKRREISTASPTRRFASYGFGFARVDLVADPTPRLIGTLFEVRSPPFPSHGRVVARFAVTLERDVKDLLAGS